MPLWLVAKHSGPEHEFRQQSSKHTQSTATAAVCTRTHAPAKQNQMSTGRSRCQRVVLSRAGQAPQYLTPNGANKTNNDGLKHSRVSSRISAQAGGIEWPFPRLPDDQHGQVHTSICSHVDVAKRNSHRSPSTAPTSFCPPNMTATSSRETPRGPSPVGVFLPVDAAAAFLSLQRRSDHKQAMGHRNTHAHIHGRRSSLFHDEGGSDAFPLWSMVKLPSRHGQPQTHTHAPRTTRTVCRVRCWAAPWAEPPAPPAAPASWSFLGPMQRRRR